MKKSNFWGKSAYTLVYNALSVFSNFLKSHETQTWSKMLFGKLI